MRASTLWQPWASLVSIGAKPYETRSYPPPAKLIGQRIAIHAAVRPCASTFLKLDQNTRFAISQALHEGGIGCVTYAELNNLPHGAVICTAVLAGAGKVKGIDDGIPYHLPNVAHLMDMRGAVNPAINTDLFGFYGPGRWAWLLTDVQRLAEPVPAKGKQGWWEWACP